MPGRRGCFKVITTTDTKKAVLTGSGKGTQT